MIGLLALALTAGAAEEAPQFVQVQMVFLEKGPKWTADVTPELEALQAKHLEHLHGAWEAGQAEVCGPADDPDGQVRGFCLYVTDTAEAAQAWAEKDPMVQAGHLSVRVVPWWMGEGYLDFPKSTRTHPVHEEGHGEGHKARHGGDHATVHHRFDDVEKWVGIFDDPGRAEWQKPEAVVEVLALEKKMAVADIGAGTGFFNPYLAAAVGKKGRVIAIDVERSLVDHMAERAEKEGTGVVVPRLGRFEDPALMPGEVDRILMVDTYHHIDNRRDYFRNLLPALRPGGQMVIVDFKPGDLPVGPKGNHKLPAEKVVAELAEAGWKVVAQPDVLPYQYVIVLEAADSAGN